MKQTVSWVLIDLFFLFHTIHSGKLLESQMQHSTARARNNAPHKAVTPTTGCTTYTITGHLQVPEVSRI